ncbi:MULTISPECIES: bifunctional phosphopantothenoylcysteine decarboxylase/phosphopantothenate--cysteine ligase CoaBC [Cytobacillus]|jgi:phosphopantothenoylcysteine decarboxylase / phosphopantothenate---cysteine ligase|uniref:Coenzyme A biosynthesis bifunctional protein CoaBC n=2 Tax=Cytobacillus oceanisediminis TaxID=665099 RepID=A0A160M9J1_9BACI|nr:MULTISPECIES: bifunctional phosphopantothenoylcysteine decarboxylase/phosphopantothenate--cysteine ligase CoaBC [Cytobacillus]EFV79468.1 bifunctional phosphopantothenoylcysteine decarboxylase/phosphopantothenate synthase [Bacillus sp. 2_A_57_CT2]MBY0157466.1 bifunctional phosphopantothenoylcysteine decarboxylase/phosphopantothenate--cysteine ligase CoaBC [Cytobacillus firmus]AND39332.1 phosphopantothenoylcysteine decarboxylase [Cytobacillus oceanisediminis 2691]MCM3242904.1 bifunctional phos
MLTGKKILLCVTGGIAVYKAAALTSKLTQAGAQVKVILSESAAKFVAPLTFQALSRHDVYTDTFDEKDSKVIAHIDLADWADLILVAPATANVIGKLANGIADNMITTTLLAASSPIWIAPAMNVHMYSHPAVQKNIETLYRFGCRFIEPSEGYLACGYVGKGRLEEPEKIIDTIEEFFKPSRLELSGRKVVITAGPTREKIDPVRYITNHSSGKMGYAIAEAAVSAGAEVVLISGPVTINAPAGLKLIKVESAEEMYQAAISEFDHADVVIKTAAVSDYRPKVTSAQKMKKQPGDELLELERTKDILFELGQKKKKQILIGFAAETEQVDEYAQGKLKRKNADLIVANNVTAEGAGFGTDTNIVTFFKKDGSSEKLPLMAKKDVAVKILEEAAILLKDEHE